MHDLGSSVLLLLLALAILLWRSGLHLRAGLALVALTLCVAAASFALLARGSWPKAPEPPANRPIAVEDLGYVSDQACRSCHPHEFSTWHDSYHRTMTQVATPTTVLGDFDDVELEYDGHVVNLERDGDTFWVELERPWGTTRKRWRREVVLTTGSHHMQVYWYATGRGRELAQVPFAYLLGNEQRWVPEPATFIRPPTLDASPAVGLWNDNCIQCHTTLGRPHHRGAGQIDTKVADFGISCQACHGPGKAHVEANQQPARRYSLHLTNAVDTSIEQPERMKSGRSSEVCGQCHSVTLFPDASSLAIWANRGFSYRPGEDLDEHRVVVRGAAAHPRQQQVLSDQPEFMRDRFWPDGMIRVSGREYNGLIESPCAVDEQFSCVTCHVMHQPVDDPRPRREWANDQLRVSMDTNEACYACHEEYRANLTAHTRHQAESSGSLCYNCHMSYTTYGLLKAIRSHQIDSPSVAASIATGRPNACNQCHLDRTLAWTEEELGAWRDPAERTAPVALLPDEEAVAASILQLLQGDAGQRALMAWSMGWDEALTTSGNDWQAPYLAQLLVDPYAAVRFIAGRSIVRLPGFESFEYDYVGPETERQAAREDALRIWRANRPDVNRRPFAHELLMDAGPGGWNEERAMTLLAGRDDRDVSLKE